MDRVWRYVLFLFLLAGICNMLPGTLTAQSVELPALTYDDSKISQKEIISCYEKVNQLIVAYPDSARQLFQRGIAQSNAQHYFYGVALHTIGLAHLQSDPKIALRLLSQVKKHVVNEQDADIRGMFYLLLSRVYNNLEYKDSAIAAAYELLKVALDQPGADPEEANSSLAYQTLAACYSNNQKDELLSIYYYEKALELEKKYKRSKYLGRIYFGLGSAYANSNNGDTLRDDGYRKGLHFLQQALPLLTKDTFLLLSAYQNISGVYGNLNDFDSARVYAQKSLAYSGAKAAALTRIQSYYLLGILSLRQNRFAEAINDLKNGLNLAKENGLRMKMVQFYLKLSYASDHMHQYDTALFYLKRYVDLQDSLVMEEKMKLTVRLELNFRSAEKDKTIAQKNLELNEQKNRIKTNKIWMAAGLLTSFCLLGWIILFRRNVQLRRGREAEQLKQELTLYQQGEEIRHLNAMIKGEEKERARLGRELHDGIVSQLAAVKLNMNIIRLKYPLADARQDYENMLLQLDETALDLRKTAHNLMPGILIEHGLVHALESYCEKTSNFTGIDIRFIYEAMIPRMEPDLELSLYRMVQELVQNIIKHAGAARALVQIDFHDPLLILTVEDNGTGIDLKTATLTGIGLSNLQSRVKALQGRMDIKGSPDRGTSVFLEFDLSLINKAGTS